MKKYFTILAVMLSMTMVGCDKDETPEEKDDAVKASLVGTWELETVKAVGYNGTQIVEADIDLEDLPEEYVDELTIPDVVKFTKTHLTIFVGTEEATETYTIDSKAGTIEIDNEDDEDDILDYVLSEDKNILTIKFGDTFESETEEMDYVEIVLTFKKRS